MFVCEIMEQFEIELLQGEGEHICTVPLGSFNDDRVSLLVALARTPGLPAYAYDLTFQLIRIDGAREDEYFDGLQTKPFIPVPEHRAAIADAIYECVTRLIDVINPRVVSVETHTPNLPDAALRKFHRIASLFREKGYRAGQADRYHGRRIWMMERDV